MGTCCEVIAVAPAEARALLAHSSQKETLDGSRLVSLEKAWHGLHFLLSGSAFEGELPLGFLLQSGANISGSDEGPRLFLPDEVHRIADALAPISDDVLWSRFDAESMTEQEIYPQIWDEPEEDLREEYLMYFNQLKALVAQASRDGQALLVDIG